MRSVHPSLDQEGGDQETADGDRRIHREGGLNPVDETAPALGAIARPDEDRRRQTQADRATGDPVANRKIRNRFMYPFEVPIFGAIGILYSYQYEQTLSDGCTYLLVDGNAGLCYPLYNHSHILGIMFVILRFYKTNR